MVNKIKIYADTGNPDSVRDLDSSIAGFTTNPTIVKSRGAASYMAFASQYLLAVSGRPCSFEVLADDLPTMADQAELLHGLGENVWVKIPVCNSHGEFTSPLVRDLVRAGIKVNVTAVFTKGQVRGAIDGLKDGVGIISVFAGRIADTGRDPERIIRSAEHLSRGSNIQILWASTREPFNVLQAARAGAHIITMGPELIRKHLAAKGRDLGEFCVATVRQFYEDAQGIRL